MGAAVTNGRRGAANRRVQHAAVLAVLPKVAAAYAAGEIGVDQIQQFARLHANPRAADLLPPSEDALLGWAREWTAHDFEQACDRWLAFADPDGGHRDQEMSRENRKLGTAQLGAGFTLRAEGDALSGEIITEIQTKHAEAEFHADVAARAAQWGGDAAAHPLARTAAQRAYDGFVAALLKAAGTNATTDRKPLVIIHTTRWDFEQAIRTFMGVPEEAPTDTSPRLRWCATDAGAPVDPRDLVIAALIGRVQQIVSDPKGLTIHLGRQSRLFVGSARDAVLLAGRRCCWPGCDAPDGSR